MNFHIVKEVYAQCTGADDTCTFTDFESMFGNILGILLGVAGLAAFIMLLMGGLKYITAGGNPKNAESAKNTLTYAIGGLVLVASAYLIIRIIEEFTGVNLSEFRVTR
jgi:Ca2+/H+ antiporter